MKIIHISAECYPIAKVGGLADVVGALPKYQSSKKITSEVLIPFYDTAFTQTHTFTTIYKSKLNLGDAVFPYEIKTLDNNTLGFEVFFVDIPQQLFRNYVYSSDDADRFISFQIASLDWLLTWKDKPTIVHCHDHHTGLIPFMMSQSLKYKKLSRISSVLTIHNAQYQGWFSYDKLAYIPEFDMENAGLLDWNHQINSLATGIKCAWRVTTVSPSYMEELKVKANGLESLLRHEHKKCSGILNGIDTDVWNPETDDYIVKNYGPTIVQSGKKANKKYLCDRFNLDIKKPLIVFIGRLVGEKGAELLPVVFDLILQEKHSSILLLGSGNKEIEKELEKLKEKHKGTYNAFIGYDEKLSHIMYAGADFLLMPSRVEPCGLNQMYALRYGTIPVVRNIGGLKDTIIDIDNKGFGIIHQEVSVYAIVYAIKRAESLYKHIQKFKNIRNRIMGINHSWDTSAQAYINLYKTLNTKVS